MGEEQDGKKGDVLCAIRLIQSFLLGLSFPQFFRFQHSFPQNLKTLICLEQM